MDISTSSHEEIFGGSYSVELSDEFCNGVEQQKHPGFIRLVQYSWLVVKVDFTLVDSLHFESTMECNELMI